MKKGMGKKPKKKSKEEYGRKNVDIDKMEEKKDIKKEKKGY
jgi:hypothetical protein